MAEFNRNIRDLGTVGNCIDFLTKIKQTCIHNEDTQFFYRGEFKDYGETALTPGIMRNSGHSKNEDKIINEMVSYFPERFPRGTSTFDILVDLQHFQIPTRLLDITTSPLVALFMACYNFNNEPNPDKDVVYIFEVLKKDIKNWNSDSVALISNLARMPYNFNAHDPHKEDIDQLVHTIFEEKNHYFNMYEPNESHKYSKDFNKILCVRPKNTNDRINRQQGLFFLFGVNDSKENYKAMKFDDSVRISKITIAGNSRTEILKDLAILGYDKITLFPDMQNIGEGIAEKYRKSGKTDSLDTKNDFDCNLGVFLGGKLSCTFHYNK